LSGFENPVNFAQVAYACQRAAWSGERLYVVGCDAAGGDDIWVTSRDVEAAASWFSSSLWSQPLPITNDSLAVTNVELVATGDALVHAFFSQRQDSSIYYTRWDGVAWSRIAPVLKLPDGQAGWPAIAAGPRNELYLVARSISGSLYGSRANSHDAVMESAWSTPTLIPIAQEGRASPANVVWDAAGTLHLAYSVPVNEERGVYLIQSSDQGKTWSDPLQVFDGAAEGFDFVGTPELIASADGSMHILWKRQSVNADGVSLPLSLHYVRTEGASPTVSEATPISDVPAGWREIVVDGKGNLHGLWQSQDMLATLWDRVSSDGGQTWQAAQRLPSEEGAAAVTVDQAGQVHLLGLGLGSLSHWLWDGIRWQAEASQRWSLAEQPTKPPSLLTAAVNTNRNLVAVWALATEEGEEDATTLLYSTRLLDLAPQQTVVQVTATQAPSLPTPTPTTLALEPSATPAPTVERQLTPMPRPTEANSASIPLAQYAMFVLPVALLTLVVLGIVAFRIIQDRVH